LIQLEVATFAPLAIASTRFAAGTPAAYRELGEGAALGDAAHRVRGGPGGGRGV
jgi:hypothetical protein